MHKVTSASGATALAALAQIVLALAWTAYVVFLPGLLERAGIAKSWLAWLLIADQLVFALADWRAGVAADRLLATWRRVAPLLAAITAASAIAFGALAGAAAGGAAVALALIFLWSVTTAALRAPALALLARGTHERARPRVGAAAILGLGLAAAASPAVGAALRGMDPLLPMTVISVVVIAAGLALLLLEPAPPGQPAAPAHAGDAGLGPLRYVALAALATAVQFHTVLFMPQHYRTLGGDPVRLAAVFWLGVSVAAAALVAISVARAGRLSMPAIGVAGLAGLLAASLPLPVAVLVAANFVAGVAWGWQLTMAFMQATAARNPGRSLGLLFALLAGSALLRLLAQFVGALAPEVARDAAIGLWAAAILLGAAAASDRLTDGAAGGR